MDDLTLKIGSELWSVASYISTITYVLTRSDRSAEQPLPLSQPTPDHLQL